MHLGIAFIVPLLVHGCSNKPSASLLAHRQVIK